MNIFGSNASLIASPIKVAVVSTRTRAEITDNPINEALVVYSDASLKSYPQLGVGGTRQKPR